MPDSQILDNRKRWKFAKSGSRHICHSQMHDRKHLRQQVARAARPSARCLVVFGGCSCLCWRSDQSPRSRLEAPAVKAQDRHAESPAGRRAGVVKGRAGPASARRPARLPSWGLDIRVHAWRVCFLVVTPYPAPPQPLEVGHSPFVLSWASVLRSSSQVTSKLPSRGLRLPERHTRPLQLKPPPPSSRDVGGPFFLPCSSTRHWKHCSVLDGNFMCL